MYNTDDVVRHRVEKFALGGTDDDANGVAASTFREQEFVSDSESEWSSINLSGGGGGRDEAGSANYVVGSEGGESAADTFEMERAHKSRAGGFGGAAQDDAEAVPPPLAYNRSLSSELQQVSLIDNANEDENDGTAANDGQLNAAAATGGGDGDGDGDYPTLPSMPPASAPSPFPWGG